MKTGQKLVGKALRSMHVHETRMHAHPHGQFTFVRQGLIGMETENGAWVVPEARLVWIPPGLGHASRSRGPIEGWLVFASPAYSRHLPGQVTVLKASPLLVAALDRIGGPAPMDEALRELLCRLVLIEIKHTEAEDFGVPLPSSPRLRAWAVAFLAACNVKMSIDAAASEVGLSRRSFTRHFEQETGKPFSEWKRLVMVQHAVERLASGEAVGAIAFDMGYENPSAYIAMFKAVRGMPPGKFMSSLDTPSPSAPIPRKPH